MKKLLILMIALSFILSLSAFSVSAAPSIRVMVGSADSTTVLFPINDTFYLPAAVDVTNVKVDFGGKDFVYRSPDSQLSISFTYAVNDESGIDLTPFATVDSVGTSCYDVLFSDTNGAKRTVRFYIDEKLSSVYVQTSKGISFIEASKDNRDKDAECIILDENGETVYSDSTSGTSSEIKGRGNASFGYYKKGFQIKLNSKTKVLGMEKAKTWILIPNYVDQSQMHNALAFQMGDDLCLPYNIEYRYTNLYIDGSYRGIYLLCEKVQIDSARIDIDDLEKRNEKANPTTEPGSLGTTTVSSGALIANTILSSYSYAVGVVSPADITGGYLVELDNVWGTQEPCRFTTENGNTYVVKSPEYASQTEMEYIATLFADMEEAIYAENGINGKGKHYSEYLDTESTAAVYAVEEMTKNWDAYLSSVFFYKDADKDDVPAKIFMGPLWDFDNTFGNLKFGTYASDTAFLWAQDGIFQNYTRTFAKKLMEKQDFATCVAGKIDTLCLKIRSYLAPDGFLEDTYRKIAYSVFMDRALYGIDNPKTWVLGSGGEYKVSTGFVYFGSYGLPTDTQPTTALGYLHSFLSERAQALLLSIGSGELPKEPEETTTVAETTTVETTGTNQAETSAETTQVDTNVADSTTSLSNNDKGSPLATIIIVSCSAVIAMIVLLLLLKRKSKA